MTARTNLDDRAAELDWITRAQMDRAGYVASGPEIDYGMRWGARSEVRVSFAPTEDLRGFLYAFDRERERFAILCESVTFEQVDVAWSAMADHPVGTNDYLVMADIVEAPARIVEARSLWWHCVEQELDARRHHEGLSGDASARFEAARAVVIARSARVASESLLVDASSAPTRGSISPVVVNYRVLGRDDWRGRVAGTDLPDVSAAASRLSDLARAYGFDIQATSLNHGNVVVAAARVPELQAVAQPTLTSGITM